MDTIAQLGRLPQVPVDMTLEGLAALNRTQQADTIGLQELGRQQRYNLAADPMRLQQMQINNDLGLQDLHTKTRTNREQDTLSPTRVMAEYKKYLAEAGSADITMAENNWRKMAMSNDPKVAALGRQGLATTKEFILQKEKDAADMARVKQMGANQLAVANVRAASRERVAALAAKAKQEMNALKSPKDWEEYAVRKQLELQQEGDLEARGALSQQIQFAQQMAERLKPAQQTFEGAPLTDPRGVIPQPPVGQKPTTPQPAQHSLTQLRGMYPGKSDAEIKAAYKARFGVEPK